MRFLNEGRLIREPARQQAAKKGVQGREVEERSWRSDGADYLSRKAAVQTIDKRRGNLAGDWLTSIGQLSLYLNDDRLAIYLRW